MHVSFALLWLTYNFFREAYVNADEKCFEKKDERPRKDGFIRCPKSMIFIEDVKLGKLEYYWQKWREIECPVYLNPVIKALLNCNGLFNVCDINGMVNSLSFLEKYEAYNWNRRRSRPSYRMCIVYDCIHGQMNTLIQSPTINKARGSLYQAVRFTGFLRCGIYGNISIITVFQSNSSQISIRDKNGYEVVDSDDIESKGDIRYWPCRFDFLDDYHGFTSKRNWKFPLFKITMNKDAVEVTMFSDGVSNVTFLAEGGTHYMCDNATFGLKSTFQRENQTVIDGDRYQAFPNFFVHRMPWIFTSISTTLSLVLTVVCVRLCLLRRKNKTFADEIPENVHVTHTNILYRLPRESYFESQLYMENGL